MAKKVRCSFEGCSAAAQRISGDCDFCKGRFCSKHRLLEDHKCQNLEDWWLVGLSGVLPEDELADLLSKCRKEAHERNAMLLNESRTQVIKTA